MHFDLFCGSLRNQLRDLPLLHLPQNCRGWRSLPGEHLLKPFQSKYYLSHNSISKKQANLKIGRKIGREVFQGRHKKTKRHIKRCSTSLVVREMQIKPQGVLLIPVAAQSCLTLGDPMDWSPAGSSVHRIFQVGILEWVAIPVSRGSSQPRDRTRVSCIAGRFFTS